MSGSEQQPRLSDAQKHHLHLQHVRRSRDGREEDCCATASSACGAGSPRGGAAAGPSVGSTAHQRSLAAAAPDDASSPELDAVPVTDRIVMLEKLGQGATGRVFRAFDVQELRFVAMKCVPIVDRAKRHQMVHELHALHRSLKAPLLSSAATEEGEVSGLPPLALCRRNVVAFYDAFTKPACPQNDSFYVEYFSIFGFWQQQSGCGDGWTSTRVTVSESVLSRKSPTVRWNSPIFSQLIGDCGKETLPFSSC